MSRTAEDRDGSGRGYLLAASAAALWGLSGVISKHLFRGTLRPIELVSIRTVLAALILFAWLGCSAPRLLRIRRVDLAYFFLLGIIGVALNQYLYYVALDLTSVGFALLLQYLAPLLLMGYGVLAGTERMTVGKAAAAILAVGGCALMVAGQAGGVARVSLPGVVFALGSACCFAFYTGYGQYGLRRYEPRTVLAYAFFFSALAWLLLRPPWTLPLRSYDGATWGLILYLASFATVLPFGLYLMSLRHLEASRTNLTSTLEPVVAAALAWLVLGERLGPVQILGGAAVLGGLILLQVEQAPLARRAGARLVAWLRN